VSPKPFRNAWVLIVKVNATTRRCFERCIAATLIFKSVFVLTSRIATSSARCCQEDQLGTLGLVVNAVILWNTIYMDAALAELRAEGFDVRDEDVARLSPLGHGHLNVLGRYAFTLPEFVARGELRPLRRPGELSDDDA
jgi:hypothetical protein